MSYKVYRRIIGTPRHTETLEETLAEGVKITLFDLLSANTGYTLGIERYVSGQVYKRVEYNAYTSISAPQPSSLLMVQDVEGESIWFMPEQGYTSADYTYRVNGGAWLPTNGNKVSLAGIVSAVGGVEIKNSGGTVHKSTKAYIAPTVAWSGPLDITTGGTYTGNYQSTDPLIPAINIRTSQPVTLLNCRVRHAGRGINYSNYGSPIKTGDFTGCHLTMKNCRGYGISPTTTLTEPRLFVVVENYKHVDIQNCYNQDAGGIKVVGNYAGNFTASNTIKVKYNWGYNISGQISPEGQPHKRIMTNWFKWSKTSGKEVPHAEVSWNYIHNRNGVADVEDVISFSNVRGTSASPIACKHNIIRGANYKTYQLNVDGSTYYSGGGIIVESPEGTSGVNVAANIDIEENLVMDSNNYHIGVASGRTIRVRNNKVISKAMADKIDFQLYGGVNQGEYTGSSNGIYVRDDLYTNTNGCQGCIVESNTYGIVQDLRVSQGYVRRDEYWGSTTGILNTTPVYLGSEVITEETINGYEREWWDSVKLNNLTIGPSEVTGGNNAFTYTFPYNLA